MTDAIPRTCPSAFIAHPHLRGLEAIFAAITHEADYQITRAGEGPLWTREAHVRWLLWVWRFGGGRAWA